MATPDPDLIRRAAAAIAGADALLIGAGAGMGVDSGLPDFRGTQGFWRAYPPFASAGLEFEDVASPTWFRTDPALAWGFYGHRGNLYRATRPHDGFQILLRWAGNRYGGTLIRINPREVEIPPGQIGLGAGALDALRAIDAALP